MQDQPQDFEELRQLLTLKRHENPPPGYFRDFSSRVLARIEGEDTGVQHGWLARLAALFQARPAISWSFCMATCLVAIAASTLFEGESGNSVENPPSIHAVATMNEPATANSGASSFLFTNLEPRQFALEMAPPVGTPAASNSLFTLPFYLRPEFRGEGIPAKYETMVQP